MNILYKKAKTGGINFWQIEVIHHPGQSEIRTTHGLVDSSNIPTPSSDFITQGKNIGKANETTPATQAEAEALSKWKKQKGRGYADTKEDAEIGKVDENFVKGGIEPMLALSYLDHMEDIAFPWIGQPKLDGIRATIIKFGQSVTIWSKERNQFTSCPHIENVLRAYPEDFILDGELYNHLLKADFNKVVSLIRNNSTIEKSDIIQFHIFDIVEAGKTYQERQLSVKNIIKKVSSSLIVEVECIELNSDEEVLAAFKHFRELGYEGLMLRDKLAQYIHGRTDRLLKMKDFIDAEFEIIGMIEGRGNWSGKVANFVVKVSDTVTAKARIKCSMERAKELFENPHLWQGKRVTVRFQEYTKSGSLRNPRAIEIRDYE